MTLNQQINEVLNSGNSNKVKREALIKLGIGANDARMLMTIWDKDNNVSTGAKSLTFGVEMECFVRYENVHADGLFFEYQSYNHRDSKKIFKFVTDGSVRGLDNAIECVSPVLPNNAKGLNDLKKCCKALNEQDAKVNKTCGLHVHIGVEHLSFEQYLNIFKNYQMLERLIDSFMAKSRRGNNAYYCRSIVGADFSNCHDVDDIIRKFRCTADHPRYHKVNPCAYGRHKTIEFRQHQGTTDYTKIMNWVTFCACLVDYSKNNVIGQEITNIDDVPFIDAKLKKFFKSRIQELSVSTAA